QTDMAKRPDESQAEGQLQPVDFIVAGQSFGVDILMVHEVIGEPRITTVPDPPDFIKGVINLRGIIIPIIELRKRLRPDHTAEKSEKIWFLIVKVDERITGFIVDAVPHVLKLKESVVEPAPDIVLEGLKSQYIRGVAEIDQRLLILLDFSRILQLNEIRQLNREITMKKARADERLPDKSETEGVLQLVEFIVAGQSFGVDILMVQEVIGEIRITRMPNTPDFIKGVINLRGSIIPIIELRKRLRPEKETEENEKIWILIVNVEERITGFIVDAVPHVLKIKESIVEPAPDIVLEGLKSQYIRGVAEIDEKLLFLLDFNQILQVKEIRKLKMKQREERARRE
ncbi:MAG: purine-binding chemotaxis protein CheW, partial [Desulfobacterales bacterium]|nr:purine-binding chemotaxis protein CheW [Desulfobacterales bacterium]